MFLSYFAQGLQNKTFVLNLSNHLKIPSNYIEPLIS